MSLPKKLQLTFSPSEINYLAENEPITILSRYSMSGTQLIGTKLPNLKPLQKYEVPLWLAMILKLQDKCNIITPEWLSIEFLKSKYEEEIKFPNKFSELPWHWIETSKKLLDKSSDDIIDPPYQIRSIVQDLREIRQIKARKGLKELNESFIQLDGLSLLEINELRPFIIQVMDQLRKMYDNVKSSNDDDEDDEQDASQRQEFSTHQTGEDQFGDDNGYDDEDITVVHD
ncbi:hypothetical protein B5S33_g413 [[Candida] boidinii]|nr:hypothetical protein B5S33_g413 [[Candida] boidinii]